MRPTVEEQLQGTCRILENVVAPCVADPYARTLLASLIGNLRMLSGAFPAIPGFLAGDNRSTAALLGQLEAVVEPDLAARIGTALTQAEPTPPICVCSSNATANCASCCRRPCAAPVSPRICRLPRLRT